MTVARTLVLSSSLLVLSVAASAHAYETWKEPGTTNVWTEVVLATDDVASAAKRCQALGMELPKKADFVRAEEAGYFRQFMTHERTSHHDHVARERVHEDLWEPEYKFDFFWTSSTGSGFQLHPVLGPFAYPEVETLPAILRLESDLSLDFALYRRDWSVVSFYDLESGPEQFNVVCLKRK